MYIGRFEIAATYAFVENIQFSVMSVMLALHYNMSDILALYSMAALDMMPMRACFGGRLMRDGEQGGRI